MVGVLEYAFAGTLFCVFALSSLCRDVFMSHPKKGNLLSCFFVLIAGSFLFGLFYIAQTFIVSSLVWLLYQELKVKRAATRLFGVIVWVLMLGWLCWLNFERTDWFDPTWSIGVTGSVMLMTIKFTSLITTKDAARVSLNTWLGWTFFLPSFFTGPTLELSEFCDFVDRKPLPNQLQSTETLLEAFWYLPFVIIGQASFPIKYAFEASDGMVYRMLFIWMSLWCIRCQYYFAWKLSEAAYQACGASQIVSHGGRNVNVFKVEQAQSFHAVLSNWNVCTSVWLKQHVYTPANELFENERVAILVTNLVSAIWHGLYPGYFITFIGAGVATAVGRMMHTNIDPKVPDVLRPFYGILMMIFVSVVLLTMAIPFEVFTVTHVWDAWKGLYFIGHIWLGIATIASLSAANKELLIETKLKKLS